MESGAPDTAPVKKPEPRGSTIRYMGFACTTEGRSYRLRVDGAGEPRLFTVTIPNEAFASHKARFQDAPELCVARLRHELDSNADLPDGLEFLVTPGELDAYREAQARRAPSRKSRAARTGS